MQLGLDGWSRQRCKASNGQDKCKLNKKLWLTGPGQFCSFSFFLTGAWRGKSIDDQSTRTHACTYSTAAVDNSSGQMKEKRKRLCVWYARKLKFPRRVFKYRKLLLGTVSEFDSKKRLGRVTNSFPYRLGACLIFTRLPTKSVNNTLTKKKLAGWLAWRTGKAQK